MNKAWPIIGEMRVTWGRFTKQHNSSDILVIQYMLVTHTWYMIWILQIYSCNFCSIPKECTLSDRDLVLTKVLDWNLSDCPCYHIKFDNYYFYSLPVTPRARLDSPLPTCNFLQCAEPYDHKGSQPSYMIRLAAVWGQRCEDTIGLLQSIRLHWVLGTQDCSNSNSIPN